jgi:tetratricopeptide (TPR) repeat protein
VPKQPSRPIAKKDDLDLRPPEELRAGRIRRFVFLGAIAAAVLGVGIYFAARPISGAIKGWQSRRSAREAFTFIDQGKWSEANAKARDALFLRSTEPESWRAIARLATRTNQWPAALLWWKKVDDANRLTVEDRRDFINAAIISGETGVAAKQVEALLAQPGGPMPIDIVWAGQVAKSQGDPELALDYAQRVLADKRARPYDVLSAATLVLSLTSPDSQPYAYAWRQLENAARDPKNPGSLEALVLLANEKAVPPMSRSSPSLSLESTPPPEPTRTSATQEPAVSPTVAGAEDAGSTTAASTKDENSATGLSLGSTPQPITQSVDTITLDLAASAAPGQTGRTMSLTEVANALENHPDARPYHKLLAFELRARQDPALADQYVADAVQRFGNAARLAQTYQGGADLGDETLLALATWLNSIGRPAKTLEVLPQELASQRQDLFLQYLNALGGLQRWNEIKDLLMSERFPIEPVLQHMYLAVAQTHLGTATGATAEWQRALEVATTSQKLSILATYAEQNSANDIADAAYANSIKIEPKNREAYTGRLRLALAAGKTADAQTITAEIIQLWPDDAAARNQNAYLRLLLGASGEQAEAAEREANVLVKREPRSWQARATLGLARFRLGRDKDALEAFRGIKVTGNEPPGALAVRAALLAANGIEEGARNDALLLVAKPLLPEERALITPLLQ